MPDLFRALPVIVLLAGCDNRTADTVQTPPPPPAPTAVGISDATAVAQGRIGPIAVGMTRAEAERAAGEMLLPPRDPAAGADACLYAHLARGPAGLSFMLTGDVIARIDIDAPATLRTPEGIGIGSREADAANAYGSGLTFRPRKYEPGHDLVVTGGADQDNLRYVFETDGHNVLRYRTGRLPEVEFVERCG
jgi:hypothetical protein